MKKANVLILLPTLGEREEYLLRTLSSIKNQTYKNYDIAMIFPLDNRVTSKIADEAGAIKVKDPGGLSAALNAGMRIAGDQYEYISWIGDDDLLSPDSLEVAVNALDKNPSASIAYGYCDYIDGDDNVIFKSRAGSLAPWIMTWGPNLLPCPGTLFRKEKIIEVGGFDENNKRSMDLDIFLRLRKVGKFINTKHTLAAFRWHSGSMTVSGRDKALKETEHVKNLYIPKYLVPISLFWHYPVRLATKIAAKRVNKLALKRRGNNTTNSFKNTL